MLEDKSLNPNDLAHGLCCASPCMKYIGMLQPAIVMLCGHSLQFSSVTAAIIMPSANGLGPALAGSVLWRLMTGSSQRASCNLPFYQRCSILPPPPSSPLPRPPGSSPSASSASSTARDSRSDHTGQHPTSGQQAYRG